MSILTGLEKRHETMDFDNYVIDPKVKEVCLRWCENYHSGSSVLITGGVGSGKTHLAIAMLKQIGDIPLKSPQQRLINENGNLHYEDTFIAESKGNFITCSDFIMQVMDAIDHKKPVMQVLEKLTEPNVNLCVFDDFGTVKLSDYNRHLLYSLVNWWYCSLFPVIITTNLNKTELFNYDARIASRLMEMCKLKIALKAQDHRIGKNVNSENI